MVIEGKTNLFLEPNVDTDIIIPARFLKRTSLDGFEPFAFFEKRYDPETKCEPSLAKKDYEFKSKKLNPECTLNRANSQGSTFLITWFNFGCGSSREHAVYALRNYQVIIGSSPSGKNAFADIFRDNCRQNLIWTPVLQEKDHQDLVKFVESKIHEHPVTLCLDTESDLLYDAEKNLTFNYEIPSHHKDYILRSSSADPFEIAKEGIKSQLKSIDDWALENQDILKAYPKSI